MLRLLVAVQPLAVLPGLRAFARALVTGKKSTFPLRLSVHFLPLTPDEGWEMCSHGCTGARVARATAPPA